MESRSGDELLRIGVFSNLSRISVRMLRHYQDNGILEPDSVDPYTGHRYYRAEQLVTAHWVVAMRDAGLPVADIAQALIHRDNPERLRELLTHQRRRIAAERERVVNLENAFDRINTYLQESPMDINVRTETLSAHTVAAIRRIIPTYSDEGALWSELSNLLPVSTAVPSPHGLSGATFYDAEFREADVDVEVWLQVEAPFVAVAPLACRQVPAVEGVMATLKGGYEGLPEVTAAIGAYIAANGLETGTMFNIYRVSPAQNPDPATWVTEVCFPIHS